MSADRWRSDARGRVTGYAPVERPEADGGVEPKAIPWLDPEDAGDGE